MKSDERSFFFFDCEIASQTIDAKLPEMRELVAVWQKYFALGQVTQEIRKGSAQLILGDIQVDKNNNTVNMIVRLSDLKAPDAVYSNTTTGTFIQHRKKLKDGNDLGAHILISMLPEVDKVNTYSAIVEQIQGLNYREIRRVLNYILHLQYTDDPSVFEIDDPRGRRTRDGKLRRVSHLPRIELLGHPSESLVSDLERGTLSGVVLIKTEPLTPLGRAPFLRKQETQLKLTVDHDSKPVEVWKSLKSAITGQAKDYPNAKISFKLPETKRSVTVKIDSETGTPTDDLYIRSVMLKGIAPRLASSSNTVVLHLVALALPHLLASRNV